MATKEQFEAFKTFFAWEEDRAKSLTETAKVYLTLLTLFFAYFGYKITDTQFDRFIGYHVGTLRWGFWLYVVVFVALIYALTMTLRAIFMHDYEQIAEPMEFFDRSVDRGWDNEAFFDAFTANMLAATDANSAVNDQRAAKLQRASYALLAGFVIYGIVFLASAWCKTSTC